MANPLQPVSRNLARNLQQLRKARGLSQTAVARLAGIPRSTVNHLESGEGNPSLLNLTRIASCLQISIEELLAAPRAEVKLVRRAEQTPQRRAQGGALVYKLLPDPIPGMEIDRMELEPGARMGGIPHLPGTKEYLTCLQGEVTVYVAGQSFRVEAGDVLAFPGSQAHSYQNSGRSRSVSVSVVTLAPSGV